MWKTVKLGDIADVKEMEIQHHKTKFFLKMVFIHLYVLQTLAKSKLAIGQRLSYQQGIRQTHVIS